MIRTLYVATAAALELAAVAFVLARPELSGPPQTGALFLAAVPGALAAIFLPTLRPRDPLLIWLTVLVAGSLGATALGGLVELRPGFGTALWGAWFKSLFVQGFVSFVAATGVRMRETQGGLEVHEPGPGREDRENLFLLYQERFPEAEVSLYRFQLLMDAGVCLVATEGGRLFGSIQAVRLGTHAVVHTLLTTEQAAERPREILHALILGALRRPEVRGADHVVALADSRSVPEIEAYSRFGFVPLPVVDDDLDHILAVRRALTALFETQFPDWKPLAECDSFLGLRAAQRSVPK